MANQINPASLHMRLVHTWLPFFGRYGRFTAVQEQAIPPILDGRDALVMAATASGKTEAVIAPLLERYWETLKSTSLGIIYICPTRALVRDLYERLHAGVGENGLNVAMKTGDVGALKRDKPISVLITTPESCDSLLTRVPKLFTDVQAAVLDEIHLFDNTPRGDHLRCLMPRIERIRAYAHPDTKPMQRVALSATVPDPQGVARRYLHDGVIVNVPGGRTIAADIAPLYDLQTLVDALAERASQKTLIFCNARDEVEQIAVYLHQHLPRHAEIFVHYGDLDGQMRLDVETRFAAASSAICVSTSTLELGIDIGSVDDVVLLGVPHNLTSFMQRIGRGGRRSNETRVLCVPKTPEEWVRFEALLDLSTGEQAHHSAAYGFRPSVLIQQTFSLLKQSPTGSIKLGDIRRIAPRSVTDEDIRAIVSALSLEGYLQAGRIGTWRPDELLQELLDDHEIYSNIGADVSAVAVVDAYSGRVMAYTDKVTEKGRVVLFGGKRMRVVWVDVRRFGLAPAKQSDEVDDVLRFRKSYALIPFNVAQAVGRSLEIPENKMALIPTDVGVWLFHFWGTMWGELLADFLLEMDVIARDVNAFCLYLPRPITQLPPLNEERLDVVAKRTAVRLSERLEMGRFHTLLPMSVGQGAAVKQINVPQFIQIYRQTTFIRIADQQERFFTLRT